MVPTVVHVITRLDLGGAQENTLSTCRGLSRQGFRTVLLAGPGGPLDSETEGLAIRWLPALSRPISPRRDLRAWMQLLTSLGQLQAEHQAAGGTEADFIVHTHTSKAGLLGRWACRRLGIRQVVHSIHGFPFHPGQREAVRQAFQALEKAAARTTRAFIAVSRANLAEAQALGIVRPHHWTRVIRSGFDLSAFRSAEARCREIRSRLRVDSPGPLWVSVANLKPQKDPLTLVRAVALARRELPNLALWFAGDGPLRSRVEAEVRQLGLKNAFHLLGWRRDVPELMAAADGVALSSRFEGLPRTVVQAVATGRPVVATRVDGTSEVVRDGKNGRLVEPDDPRSFAQALVEVAGWASGPTVRLNLEDWSEERLVAAQASLYEALVNVPPNRIA